MKNLAKEKIRIVKKREPKTGEREPVTMRCGARVTTITFPNPKKKGEVKYHSNYNTKWNVMWEAECSYECSSEEDNSNTRS